MKCACGKEVGCPCNLIEGKCQTCYIKSKQDEKPKPVKPKTG